MKKTVSVIIPAHNEEKNIYRLLISIFRQKQRNFILEQITISSDGSTDNTVKECKRVSNAKIIVNDFPVREGKVKRLNQAFTNNTSDILIQLDADITFKYSYVLEQIVQPFIDDNEMSIVYGNQEPFLPNTYVGNLAYFGFYAWEEAKKGINAERYNCFGQLMAFSKAFLKAYKLPEEKYFTEDTYSFYFAKTNNYKTYFQKSAIVLFRLPTNTKDYVLQMNRYLTTRHDMEVFFGKKIVRKYETITRLVKFKALLKYSIGKPLHINIGYILLQTITKMEAVFFKEQKLWHIISTTKIY